MNNRKRCSGFTLIEAVVVIAIISVLLFFTAPLLTTLSRPAEADAQVARLILLIQELKQAAVENSRDYMLHVDPSAGGVWISHEDMDEEDMVLAETERDRQFSAILIQGVEFPGIQGDTPAPVRFYKMGYSDMALIHIRAADREMTVKIEPFLPDVLKEDGYFSYHDCM